MNTKQTFTILFWIQKARSKKGKAPLFARITINGERRESSVNREVSILDWDPGAQVVSGRSEEAKEINNRPVRKFGYLTPNEVFLKKKVVLHLSVEHSFQISTSTKQTFHLLLILKIIYLSPWD